MGKTTVLAWEHGTAFPNAAFLAAIAQLGADVRYIITGSREYEPPEPLQEEERLLLAHWRAATRPVKNAALGALLGVASRARTEQIFHGTVGQIIEGDYTASGQTLNFGSSSSKRGPKKP